MNEHFFEIIKTRDEISVRYDPETAAIWCYFNPKIRPCFSIHMLKEIYDVQTSIMKYYEAHNNNPSIPIRYFILSSQIGGIFNYGGDLNLFAQLIRNKDRETLLEYAKVCIDTVYLNAVNMHLPITTIALLEGTALGGGLEAALSSDIIIAEEGVKMGLPEIRFNLFPGMGAYSLLVRKLGMIEAEKIISSGKIYLAEELYQKGIVAEISEPNKGREAIAKFLRGYERKFNGMQAITSARFCFDKIEYEELLDITTVWVDAALRLTEKDLKVMEKLIDAQNIKSDNIVKKARTIQDRRISNKPLSFPIIDGHGNRVLHDRRKGIDRRLCS